MLEALAATHPAFDHLFLVGLSSGHFPRRAPGSPLFSEEERAAPAAAGLPLDLSAVWDARERALFTQLVAGGERGLTLSTPALDEGGRETVPSAFLEELQAGLGLTPERIPAHRVLTPGLPLLADWVLFEHRTIGTAVVDDEYFHGDAANRYSNSLTAIAGGENRKARWG